MERRHEITGSITTTNDSEVRKPLGHTNSNKRIRTGIAAVPNIGAYL